MRGTEVCSWKSLVRSRGMEIGVGWGGEPCVQRKGKNLKEERGQRDSKEQVV